MLHTPVDLSQLLQVVLHFCIQFGPKCLSHSKKNNNIIRGTYNDKLIKNVFSSDYNAYFFLRINCYNLLDNTYHIFCHFKFNNKQGTNDVE